MPPLRWDGPLRQRKQCPSPNRGLRLTSCVEMRTRLRTLALLILCLLSHEAPGRAMVVPATGSRSAEVVAEYGYRYYAAELGRWLNPDPLREAGGVNLCGMVGNNVANQVDYLGLVSREEVFKAYVRAYDGSLGVQLALGMLRAELQKRERDDKLICILLEKLKNQIPSFGNSLERLQAQLDGWKGGNGWNPLNWLGVNPNAPDYSLFSKYSDLYWVWGQLQSGGLVDDVALATRLASGDNELGAIVNAAVNESGEMLRDAKLINNIQLVAGVTALTRLGIQGGIKLLSAKVGTGAANTTTTAAEDVTYLYQKVGAEGEHLKFGITKNPATRYNQEELAGGSLRIIAKGERSEMLRLERQLHETLPIGPEERQLFYIQKQIQKGLKPPPYDP